MDKLGKKAKDKITGFEGIITGKIIFLTGCNQYCLVPKKLKDGTLPKSQWFDEGRVIITGPGITPKKVKGKNPGGPQRDTPQLY